MSCLAASSGRLTIPACRAVSRLPGALLTLPAVEGLRLCHASFARAPPRVATKLAPRLRTQPRAATMAAAAAPATGTYDYDYDYAGIYDYDLFCIGAGSGGVRASRMSASYGAKVAVCELPYAAKSSDTAGGAGGTCVIRGCVPKKLLVYGAHYAEEFKDAQGFGWALPGAQPAHDWASLMASKDKEVQRLSGIYGRILGNAGVTYIEGRGRVVDPHTVEVNGQRITAANILVATGGRAQVPSIPGSELGITSDGALTLPSCPKRVAIIGAGYIGLEFAGIFHGFGAQTHVLYRSDKPLRGFDEEVRSFLGEQYAEKGIHMHANCSPVSITLQPDGHTKLLKTSDGQELLVDEVMFATGRHPNSKNLGLEACGVALAPSGAVKVDAFSRTNVPSVFAVGDVTDRMNLTPVALMEGMALSRTLFKGDPSVPDYQGVPAAVFSQPPVATVGLTEAQAVASHGDVDVFTTSFKPMKNTISGRADKMFMKLLVAKQSDKVVGIHLCGPDAPEMLQGFAVALKCGATKAQFDATVGIHPTAAEELVTMRSVTRELRGAPKPHAAAAL